LAKLIGTAGHVDHGKTSLIRALTSIDADRLPEEKQRGMTIDIGFAYVDLPKAGRVSIVDVPGHERFLTNMLVGALGIDVAILCVAADESVMPQTREHLEILSLLPVEKLVVAMTRSDLADEVVREIARSEIEDLLAQTRFAGAPIQSVSAITGEGLDELKALLDEALQGSEPVAPGGWYLPIDRVFTVKGYGTVVTGTLAQGVVRLEDRAVLMPSGQETRIRGIEWHGEAQSQSEKGRRTALNLGKVGIDEVHRGMIVGDPAGVFSSSLVEGRAEWLGGGKHATRIRLSLGSEEVMGKALRNDHDPNWVQFKLERPIAVVAGQAFIVRRYSPPKLLGGGRVTIPQARLRRKSDRGSTVAASHLSESEQLVAWVQASRWGESSEELCRRLGKTSQALGSVFEDLKSSGKLVGFAGFWLTPDRLEQAQQAAHQALAELHAEFPAKAFLPRELWIKRGQVPWKGKPLDRLVAHWAQEKFLRVQGTEIALYDHLVRLNPKQQQLLDRVEEGLRACGMNVPPALELSRQLYLPPQAVEEILRLGLESRRLVWIAEGVIYTQDQLLQFRTDFSARVEKRPFAAAEFRDHFGSSRKYVIPLLEWMDAQGWTLRQGDSRVMRGLDSA